MNIPRTVATIFLGALMASNSAQAQPLTYDGARADAFTKAGHIEVLGVELPNATTKDTHVAILLSGINVTSPECSRRIWHIPRNKVLASSPVKDASCPGGNVTKYLVAADAVPIEEVFIARPLRDFVGAAGGPAAVFAKGEDPEWNGKTCERETRDPDGTVSVHRGKCQDVCRGREVTKGNPARTTADGTC